MDGDLSLIKNEKNIMTTINEIRAAVDFRPSKIT